MQSRLITVIMTGLILATLCSDSMAISAKIYLDELAAKADYVILGSVAKKKTIFKKVRDNSGKVISFDNEGSIHSISVKKVFFAKDPSLKREKEVYFFQKMISLDLPMLFPNKSYLLFLKEASVDPVFAKKYDLPRGKYFTVVAGRQGQIASSDLLYLNATRVFFRVKRIKNEKQRLKEWKKLLNSDNLEIRKAAKGELEKVDFKAKVDKIKRNK